VAFDDARLFGEPQRIAVAKHFTEDCAVRCDERLSLRLRLLHQCQRLSIIRSGGPGLFQRLLDALQRSRLLELASGFVFQIALRVG
jgi:hypothetical protein